MFAAPRARRSVLGGWAYGAVTAPKESSTPPSEVGEERDQEAYRYYVLAYEDARQKRPIKHEHGGTTVLASGARSIGRAEALNKEFPKGWVHVHVEYTGKKE